MRKNQKQEHGYVLLGVLLMIALTMLVTGGMIESAGTNSKTRSLVNTQSRYYYEVEETLSKTVGWLQDNSQNIVTAFTDTNFNNNFDIGTPTLGDNEGQHFSTPTLVKMKGSNNSVILSNNSYFGVNAFPSTTNISSGAAFDAESSFQAADLGSANARIVLVWARETDGNFEPIFRIDVLTGNNPDRGVHSFSYVYSTLVASAGDVGFFGKDFLTFQTPNNDCFSYLYNYAGPGNWGRGAQRANCPAASNGPINISSDINGTAKTLQGSGISLNPPGGSVSGSQCDGAGCHSNVLPVFDTWNNYCPEVTTDLTVNSDVTLAAGGCWRDASISNKKTLFLTDTTAPYYFRSLDFGPNKAKIDFGNIPQGETVTVFVESVNNDHMNGNQFYNSVNAPHQVEFNYIGTNSFKFNGTAGFNAAVVAPYAHIDVTGNFSFYGGIKSKSLTISGNARVNYDEGLGAGAPVLSDINFSLRKASQRYR